MSLALDAVVAVLLERLRAQRGQPVDVAPEDLRAWSADAVKALREGGVLQDGQPAESVVCDGCEEACVRKVHVMTRPNGDAAAFVLCHLRDDIDRIPIPLGELARWRVTARSLADALAALLPGGRAIPNAETDGGFRLGFVPGRRDRAVMTLRDGPDGLRLTLAGHVLALPDVLMLNEGRLAFDTRLLARRVDVPADVASGGSAEPPDVRGRRMLARKRELVAAGKRKFLELIAQEEGCSVSWAKQLIAKAEKPDPFAGLKTAMVQNGTVLTSPKRHR